VLLALSCMGASDPSSFQLQLEYGKKKHTFSPAADPSTLQSLYGEYSEPMALTGGESLRLYPNGKFTLIWWCDICGTETLGTGTYTFKDGEIDLTYTKTGEKFEPAKHPSSLRVFHGWIEEKDYVTDDAYILIRPEFVDRARRKSAFFDYMRKNVSYLDWQSMYEGDVSQMDARR